MKQMPKRLLSLLLSIALLVNYCPVAFAAEADVVGEYIDVVGQVETITETEDEGETAPETSDETDEQGEPADKTDEQGEPADETDEQGEPADKTDEQGEPADKTDEQGETADKTDEQGEPADESELTEETDESETSQTEIIHEALPYGLKGLPENYVLGEKELEAKKDMELNNVCAITESLTPGVDYAENQVIAYASSQQEAEIYAEAFNAELESYSYGVAVLALDDITVPQAVAASANMNLALPSVYPNHIIYIEPDQEENSFNQQTSTMSADAPKLESWESWINALSNPDIYLLNPNEYSYQYMHDTVDSYAAWGVTTGKGVAVAVVDTGVDASHPDLAGKVIPVDIGCGTGYYGGEGGEHGTHVAGIIAAKLGNGIGGAGIAPDAKILAIRVADDDGSMYTSSIVGGIYAAVDNGADVINLSLGSPSYNYVEDMAVQYAVSEGCCVVAAMGNDSTNIVNYPAAYKGVIAVGASDRSNYRANFSAYGKHIDVSAPGYDIMSTITGNQYAHMSGTSMATPVVSGVVALYKSVYPDATPAQVEARLKKTATKAGSNLGSGVVNAAKMLSETPRVPNFRIADNNNCYIDTKAYKSIPVPCESYLQFYCDQYSEDFIVYTLDGTTPAVKNGEVIKGTVYRYNRDSGANDKIDLRDYAGKSVTVKAIHVNGMGMSSKVLSKKVTVKTVASVKSVTITAPLKMLPGKSVTLTAVVDADYKADQGVIWSIVETSSNMTKAKIDSKGKLTVPKLITEESGYVKVQAASKTEPRVKSAVCTISVEAIPVVYKLVMNRSKATVNVAGNVQLQYTAYDAKKNVIYPQDIVWTSSNSNVAAVDSNGLVTAVSRGSATITCKTLDGSGKSIACKVTVNQPVYSISVTGQDTIAPGASATYKAAILPGNATNKSVIWSLSGNTTGVTVSSSGKVTVSKTASSRATFNVIATAKDGSGVVGQKQVTVALKCKAVDINGAETYGGAPGVLKRDRKAYPTEIGLFTADLPQFTGDERVAVLYNVVTTSEIVNPTLSWTSSNPSVASVDGNGRVTAHKAGTATITVAALDGSGKKDTVTVKVTIPASSISIAVNRDRLIYSSMYLGCGKSAANKVVFADTYGKPSNQKVKWTYRVYDRYDDDITDIVDYYKWIKLDSSGKLSVSSKMASYAVADGLVRVQVTATSTDGTNLSDSVEYVLVKPTTKMQMMSGTYYDNFAFNEVGRALFTTDQSFAYDNPDNCDFFASSSNPEIVNVVSTDVSNYIDGIGAPFTYEFDYYGKPIYAIYFYTGTKKGTATITIKAADGSGKSTSFKVRVK